ncbi:glycosyltransferase family 2 protein [Roseobacteraceae bacterium NS-SX3]
MTPPPVLAIILNYRTPEMTLQSAEAALQAMQGLPGEVLIVDNASGDGSFERMQAEACARGWMEDTRLRLVQSPVNGGFGAGMNFGMQAGLSDGKAPGFYYLLNSDAFPQPDAIRILRDYLMAHPGAGLAGSFVRGADGVPHRTAFRFPSAAGEFEYSAQTGPVTRLLQHAVVAMEIPQAPAQVDWTAGASLMIRREVIEETGGFDEIYFLYYEETDLCRRAAKAGWRTHFVPESEVMHVGSASTGMKEWQRTPGYWFDSRLHYYRKAGGRGYVALTTLATLAGSAVYGLRRLISRKPRLHPPHFLRDLCTRTLRALIRPAPIETRDLTPVPEEQK